MLDSVVSNCVSGLASSGRHLGGWGPCHGLAFAPALSLPGGNRGILCGQIHAAASQPPLRRKAAPGIQMVNGKPQAGQPNGILGMALEAQSGLQDVQDRARTRATWGGRASLGGVILSILAVSALLVLSLAKAVLSSVVLLLQLLLAGKRRGSGDQDAASPDLAAQSGKGGGTWDLGTEGSAALATADQASEWSAVVDAPGAPAAMPEAGGTVAVGKSERRAPKDSAIATRRLGHVTQEDLMATEYGGKVSTPKEVDGMAALRDRVLSLTEEERSTMCEQWLDGLTPIDLLRYLRGNGHRIEEAKAKLLDSARWRKENNVSSILEEHASSIDGFFPDLETREVDWLDDVADLEKGRPSLLYRSAVHTPLERQTEDWVRFFVHQCEWARVHHPDKQVLVLVDRVGSGLSNQDPTVLRALTPVILDHYPDTIGRVLIAPVNTVLFVIWGLVSLILDDTTKTRMKLLKGKDWKSKLVKCIHEDSLPERLGGTNKIL